MATADSGDRGGARSKRRVWDLDTFLKITLRGAFRKTPMFYEALNAVKEEYQGTNKNGYIVRRVRFKCAYCGRKFDRKDVQVDHVKPISTCDTILDFINRLFCGLDGLQVLCSYPKKNMGEHDGVLSCHTKKTAAEARARADKRAKG